jgi:hypothetical protein
MIPDIDKLARVCNNCLYDEKDPELPSECKHRFLRRSLWAGLVVVDSFGMRSQETVRRYLSQAVWNAESYEDIMHLSSDDARAIRDGRARLVIRIEPMEKA